MKTAVLDIFLSISSFSLCFTSSFFLSLSLINDNQYERFFERMIASLIDFAESEKPFEVKENRQ